MNEQTDKIKICDIIADCFTKEENFTWNGRLVPKLANALIAAGIGDVSEYKHRAEVAERALYKACKNIKDICEYLVKIGGTGVITIKNYAPERAEPSAYIDRAEKELAEEGK